MIGIDGDRMAGRGLVITGGTLVLPDRTTTGDIHIVDGKIAQIRFCDAPQTAGERDGNGATFHDRSADTSGSFGGNTAQSAAETKAATIDATGLWVMPGLIDLHCDAVEKEVQPRPNTIFPIRAALLEMEKKLAASGVTTMFHSLSLGTGLSLQGLDILQQLVAAINSRKRERAMIRHRLHLRYEVLYRAFLEQAEQWIVDGSADYFSYMIHAPGIGQYKRPDSFEAYVMKNQGVSREEVRELVDQVNAMAAAVDWDRIADLTEHAHAKGIAVASHDMDEAADIERAVRLGAKVSEFPLNTKIAAQARQEGMHVCVGAPNVVRGQSHDKNMRAIDAIRQGSANILCSDYYPPSMLQAVCKLADDEMPLHEAVNMVTLHPAKAAGVDKQLGSIEMNKAADLLLVDTEDGVPFIRRTLVGGETVYMANVAQTS